jgi:multisubunit Na+/H+ antiporter MnhE subunit
MFFALFAFWAILSDQTSLFFILASAISVVITLYIDGKLFNKSAYVIIPDRRWFLFLFSLSKEMLSSSFKVIRLIWFNKEFTPKFRRIETKTSEPVIYANIITLTPGTMSLHLSDSNNILVHALDTSFIDEDLENLVLYLENKK